MTGKQLGDYRLKERVGAGGMGEVYRAEQLSLDRTVAVKVLPRSLAKEENFIERFQREAKAAANLVHPHVIQIYSIGIEDGIPYFAMEYVEGDDLQKLLKHGTKFDFEEAVDIVIAVSEALSCAHDKGIIHRDIKPSNIMLDRTSQVKVMDFGLAKAVSGQSNLTQSGLIMGTPNYISPEQGLGEELDCRTDIYSLGVVFYELLTGERPFKGDSPATVIYKHAYEPPEEPHKLKEDIPPFLEIICMKMMAKNVEDRYENPKAVLVDLNEFKRKLDFYLGGGLPEEAPEMDSDIKRMSTGEFKDAPTVVDSEAGGEARERKPVEAIPSGGGPSGGIIVLILLLVGGLVTAGVIWGPGLLGPRVADSGNGTGNGSGNGGTGGTSGGTENGATEEPKKVAVPFSRLATRLPADAEVKLVLDDREEAFVLKDRELVVGEHTFRIERPGYKPLFVKLTVSEDGVSPDPAEVPLDFAPTDELLEAYEKGIAAFKDERWVDALAAFKKVGEIQPGFRDVGAWTTKAETELARLEAERKKYEAAFNKGLEFYHNKEYERAREVLRTIPKSYEKYPDVITMLNNIEDVFSGIRDELQKAKEALKEGRFERVRVLLAQIEEKDEGNERAFELRKELERAERYLDAARREVKAESWKEGAELLELLLAIAPEHREGKEKYALCKKRIQTREKETEELQAALEQAKAAFSGGLYKDALATAERILRDYDADHPEALHIRNESQKRLRTEEVRGVVKQLDKAWLQGKAFAVLDLFDSTDKAFYRRIGNEVERFFGEDLRFVDSVHRDFEITFEEGRATVLCTWEFEVAYPGLSRTTRGAFRQRLTLRPSGETTWVIVGYKQVGELNVE